LACPERKGRWRGWPGAARIEVAPSRAEQGKRKKKGRGRGEADRRGPVISGRRKKKRGRRHWAAAGGSWWAGRPAGPKGETDSLCFQTLFKTNFSFQIQTKILLNFSQNFIIFLEATQATKNHAKPKDDAQPLVVSILIKFSLIF
jgi:hypothetical protein